jgi:hypothetical protein
MTIGHKIKKAKSLLLFAFGFLFFYFNYFTAFIISAKGAGAMRHYGLAAFRTFAQNHFL